MALECPDSYRGASDFSTPMEQVVLTPAKLTAKDTWVLTRDRQTSLRFFNSKGAGGFNPCILTDFSTAK